MKTLVIVLGETRAHELTFDNFKKNIIDELDADLCLCIGVKNDYDYNNPFYKLAKYKFCYEEPDDFSSAFDYAYDTIIKETKHKYEKLNNISTIDVESINNMDNYDFLENLDNLNELNYDEILCLNDLIIGIKKSTNKFISTKNAITLKKNIYWREFLKIKDQFMGGIKDASEQHPGSGSIQIFFRWFLLQQLQNNNLIEKYERFVITRSDFKYRLPHPKKIPYNKL